MRNFKKWRIRNTQKIERLNLLGLIVCYSALGLFIDFPESIDFGIVAFTVYRASILKRK